MPAAPLTACLVAALLGGPLSMDRPQARRNWGPEQATGPADTKVAGDAVTAWATWQADAPGEWLELTFERTVSIAEIQIHETEKPGAISRVVVSGGDAAPQEVFTGPYSVQGNRHLLKIRGGGARGRVVRIELASEKFPGWNEIDAVELIGTDGSRQWAVSATASSSYADGAPPDPLHALVGKTTGIHLSNNTTLTGRIQAFGTEWVEVVVDGRSVIVLKSAILYFDKP